MRLLLLVVVAGFLQRDCASAQTDPGISLAFKTITNSIDFFSMALPIIQDFDGDGTPDIGTLRYKSGGTGNSSTPFRLLAGNGGGTFASALEIPTDHYGFNFAVSDFNQDGNLDFAIADTSRKTAGIFLGASGGTFNPASEATFAYVPNFVAAGDVNSDGAIDLVAAHFDANKISVSFGLGNGSFAAPSLHDVGHHPLHVLVADFNGDGTADILTINEQSISLLVRNGATFSHAFEAPNWPYQNFQAIVASGDFNRDGKMDFAVAGSNLVRVWFGQAGNTFTNASFTISGQSIGGIVSGDFDLDGNLDIVLFVTPANLLVFLGDANGHFRLADQFYVGIAGGMASGDIDGDGLPDLVIHNAYSGLEMYVLLNRSKPLLRMEQDSSNLKLRWRGMPGFRLTTSTDLADLVWEPFGANDQSIGTKEVVVPLTLGARFFRIRK